MVLITVVCNKLCEIIIAPVEAGESKSSTVKALNINRSTIYKAIKAYEEHGTTDYVKPSDRPVNDDKNALIEAVRTKIDANPNQSVRNLSRMFNVPESSMRSIVRMDLGLKSLVVLQVQQLMPFHQEKCLKMAWVMLNKLKKEVAGKVLIFSNENDFHLNKHLNRRNNHTIAANGKTVDPANRFQGQPKFPQKAMFLGFVGNDGKAFPGMWIKGTMNGHMYKSIPIHNVFPVLDTTYSKGNYIWMQDGASCHTSIVVMTYLKNKLGSKGFWSKGIWPPNSYNPNPLDYSVWNHIDKRANNVYHTSIDTMKAAVNREWTSMSTDYMQATCARFRHKLEACIATDGGVFEKV